MIENLWLVFLFFFGQIFFQLIIWRFFKPKKQIFLLFIIFLFLPILSYKFLDELNFLLLLSMSIQYLFVFPAAQAQSPSLVILCMVDRAYRENKGLAFADIKSKMLKVGLLQDRLEDLKNDGFTKNNNQQLGLFGKIVAAFFYIYRRKILKLNRGEG